MDVYLVTNLVNGKMYVGQTTKTIEERWNAHLKASKAGMRTRLYNAIRKYGSEVFIIERLTGGDSQEQLNKLEEMWIILLGTKDPKSGYNMTSGGDGCSGYTFSEESKGRISRAMSGHLCPQSQRDAAKKANKGRAKPLSQRQKIAAAWTSLRRSEQAEVARKVNDSENKKLNDYTCPTCNKQFRQVSRSVYGGHRKACLFWNATHLPTNSL